MKVGIVGYGIVGQALEHAFSSYSDIYIVDPEIPNTMSIEEMLQEEPAYVFVCVPTPEGTNGQCDISIVTDVINDIFAYIKSNLIVILKSTIDPLSIVKLTAIRKSFGMVYNPEFLVQATAHDDILNPSMQILGGDKQETDMVSNLYRNFSDIRTAKEFHVDFTTASLAKYSINSYLATKVTFMNSIRAIHSASESDSTFEELTEIITTDPRISDSHTKVPGDDGSYGYTGKCLPKDIKAFSHYTSTLEPIPTTILSHIILLNDIFTALDK